MRTGFTSLRLSVAGFLIPYLFVYNPAMLMIDTAGASINTKEFPMAPVFDIVLITFTAVIGIIALSAAVEGYFKTSLNPFIRLILGAGALMMIIPETITDIAGLILVAIIFAWDYIKDRKGQQNINIGA